MFVPGQMYRRREEIHEVYGGQRQGGISTPSKHPSIFIFTGESGETYGYKDEFRSDGIFWYTGEGQSGDMEMVRGNRAIRDHQQEGKAIHLFEYVDSGLVRYIGQANYLGHHTEDRPDLKGKMRKAIIFELEIDTTSLEATEEAESPKSEKKVSLKLWSRPLDEVRELAIQRPKKAATVQERRIITYQRSESVRVYVLRRAKGICECCDIEAPFITKQGRPYLEPHHIRRISDGGPDDPRWVAAVCPNCHKEVHYGKEGSLLNKALADKLGTIEIQ